MIPCPAIPAASELLQERQRRSIFQPSVAAGRLRWVNRRPISINSEGVESLPPPIVPRCDATLSELLTGSPLDPA